MFKLSAIIITKNEERNIGRCLDSIKNLANEIILVDSGSTDQTLLIAKKYSTKLFFRAWTDDYAAQKNYALTQTTADWVLAIDADEVVSPALATEIKAVLQSIQAQKYHGFYLPRQNIIFGKWLKYGDCWPDYQLRLFKQGGYFQRPVHEIVVMPGATDYLKQPLVHYHYQNIKQFITKAQYYTDLEIKALTQEQKSNSLLATIIYPAAKFLKVYFWQKGFLDGWRGLIYTILLTYYSFLKRYKFYQFLSKNDFK